MPAWNPDNHSRKVYLGNIDILDGTPLIDIKPYVPGFDKQDHVRIGWLQSAKKRMPDQRSDDRFN